MRNENLITKIENSHAVVKDAIGSSAKQITYELGALNKRVSDKFVYAQGERREIKRANFYENFLRWLTAIFYANYIGFEYLMADLQIYVAELQRRRARKLTDFTDNPPFPSREVFGVIGRMERDIEFLKGCFELETAK